MVGQRAHALSVAVMSPPSRLEVLNLWPYVAKAWGVLQGATRQLGGTLGESPEVTVYSPKAEGLNG